MFPKGTLCFSWFQFKCYGCIVATAAFQTLLFFCQHFKFNFKALDATRTIRCGRFRPPQIPRTEPPTIRSVRSEDVSASFGPVNHSPTARGNCTAIWMTVGPSSGHSFLRGNSTLAKLFSGLIPQEPLCVATSVAGIAARLSGIWEHVYNLNHISCWTLR
uniref:(northern house mosquito) hypothetical protein n=1 Tax=Culex pipiens TaxID=7175 RepID=A0A8D8B4P2_CULPI